MKRQAEMLLLVMSATAGLLLSVLCCHLAGTGKWVWWLSLGAGAGLIGGLIVWFYGSRWRHTMAAVDERHVAHKESGHIWPWQLSQIFVSHTLHNVAALTLGNPDQARQTIEQLGELMRLVVDMYRQPFTLLTQEVKCAEIFLNIEKARLNRRLQVVKDVSADCLEYRVPSLFLLPLIENAIQYGIETSESASYVILSARKELGHLLIEISETASRHLHEGSLQKMMHDSRIQQLSNQLAELFHKEQPIEFTALAPTGTRLSIMLPLQ
jgi:LytS/YehU family sensor histidine kinase